MYTNCIFVDEEVLEAILHGPDPNLGDMNAVVGDKSKAAFAKVLDDQYDEIQYQYDETEISDDEERERVNRGDEGWPPVDGCRKFDAGWVKIAAGSLIPRAYYVLMDGGWRSYYIRPPSVQNG